jgi:xanthine dehydrogenase accessory factor
MNNKKIFKKLYELSSTHNRVALATVVKTQGSTPREVGAKMMILPDGQFEGTVGGGCGEAEVWQKAMEALKSGKPRTVRIELTEDAEMGEKICGGVMEVFVDIWQKRNS